MATVQVSYSSHLSKNARLAKSFRGRIYIKPEAKAAEKTLHQELTLGLKGVKLYQNRIYLDIHVVKPRNNVDAINFLDAIADVLKKVVGVDDKWFSVKSLDWSLDKGDPCMMIKIYQPTRKHA